jgi:peptidoglycan-associated lipoprotein
MRSVLSRLSPLCLLTGLFALSLPGCKPPEYPNCKKDKHCKQDLGEKCVDGKCQNCTTDEDCKAKGPNGEDFTCFEFRCTDPSQVPLDGAGGQGSLGSPCTQTVDCSGGLVCTAGKCSNCTDDIECSPGTCDVSTGLCSTGGAAGGQCTTDDECAMDEICDAGTCVFSGIEPGGTNPCGIEAIFFDFDSPKIKQDAQAQLDQIATCLVEQGTLVYLEAHADPRGTEEYNIMLTDRRGQSVKKYLETKGVTGENLQVISKGDLEASGTDESGWSQDRRVEFIFP